MMDKEFEQLRTIFAADVDDETREENEQQIREWESALVMNEAMLSWKEHDITKLIAGQAKESYREIAERLWRDRSLTDAQRTSLWARHDAMLWILSLTEVDAKGEIERIQSQIKSAINAA